MTFWAGLGGGVGSAVGGAIGSAIGGSKTVSRKKQVQGQQFARHTLWQDASQIAPRYGFHPLIAVGSNPYVPSSGVYKDPVAAQAGADIGGAIGQAVVGKTERRIAKNRQIKIDAMNLQKHEAELAVLHSEANKNNSIADSYLASTRNRIEQKKNQTGMDKYPAPEIEPLKEMGTPSGGITYHDPGGLGDMHIPGGLTGAQMLEEMVGEPENPLNWPRMMNILMQHLQRKVNTKALKHRKYLIRKNKGANSPLPGQKRIKRF